VKVLVIAVVAAIGMTTAGYAGQPAPPRPADQYQAKICADSQLSVRRVADTGILPYACCDAFSGCAQYLSTDILTPPLAPSRT